MVKYKWKESIQIPDGSHTGEITKISERIEPYNYTDIFVKPDNLKEGQEFELKYSCPSILSENSKLGKLLIVFGEKFEKDKEIDIDEVLVGKKVIFMTLTQKGKDNKEYSEIVNGSLKPAAS